MISNTHAREISQPSIALCWLDYMDAASPSDRLGWSDNWSQSSPYQSKPVPTSNITHIPPEQSTVQSSMRLQIHSALDDTLCRIHASQNRHQPIVESGLLESATKNIAESSAMAFCISAASRCISVLAQGKVEPKAEDAKRCLLKSKWGQEHCRQFLTEECGVIRTNDQALHLVRRHPVVQGGGQRSKRVSEQSNGQVGVLTRNLNLRNFQSFVHGPLSRPHRGKNWCPETVLHGSSAHRLFRKGPRETAVSTLGCSSSGE